MIRNLVIDERGLRYEAVVPEFAFSLYILGGRTAYELVRLNLPAFLPSVQIPQSFIAGAENHDIEGQFNFDSAYTYFNSNKLTLGFVAEDPRTYSSI